MLPKIALVLGDYTKGNPDLNTIMDECGDVVNWFNNHSYALGVFMKEQKDMNDGKPTVALLSPVVTQWTSYFCALSRLLDVWKSLQVMAIKHSEQIMETIGQKEKAKRKARNILFQVRDELWWQKVVKCVKMSRGWTCYQ